MIRSLVVAAAVAGAGAALLSGPDAPAVAEPTGEAVNPLVIPGPYVERTQWVNWDGKPSLRVYPTPAGRAESVRPGSHHGLGDRAWGEVLALTPDADTPGMREQFICHWDFAELGHPGKSSWNLEPWRPVVDPTAMVLARCNPGAPEEPF